MLLDLIDLVVSVLTWGIDFLVRGLLGWRFLLSSTYRAASLERWHTQASSATAVEITAALVGITVSVALAVWIHVTLT